MSASVKTSTGENLSLTRFWSPRYWPAWVLWGSMHWIARWPLGTQLALGRAAGRLLPVLVRRQCRVALRNLEICFPHLPAAERELLLGRHLEAVGISFVEMAVGWFTPIERLRALIRVEGREHLDRALARNRGILLLSAHFTTLEVGVSILEDLCPDVSSMYRPQRNAMMDVMIRRGRSRFSSEQIPRDNVRAVLRALKARRIVAYMPDQTFVGNQSMLLPFFGEPAMTNTAISKLASISGASVLPYLFRRLPGDEGYVVTIMPPLEDTPNGDPADYTRRWVEVLEDYIRLAPEQYLWLYKKFKGRPAPLPDVYADL